MSEVDIDKTRRAKVAWIIQGLFWGFFMFVFMGILTPLAFNEEITFRKIATSFILWLVFGLIYGYVTKMVNKRWGKK